ncbi:protein RD3-like [Xyrichtys novacula]|uniref:Protein RD3-like n=1 Tax=Xyrichtys novacula TaxID=13765 RepID=A0AAV1GIX9_XYRNO|nr:protein RD3-like [Xyrichtys novacula]
MTVLSKAHIKHTHGSCTHMHPRPLPFSPVHTFPASYKAADLTLKLHTAQRRVGPISKKISHQWISFHLFHGLRAHHTPVKTDPSFEGQSTVTTMPLFSWMKWTTETKAQAETEEAPFKTPEVVPSRMLIRELLWHVEERERLARELERENRLTHSALGTHWFQKYPRLRTLIPTSELHQLEFLCAQIPFVHAATVLSRFREVLATNNIKPWELASVFKQVLRDFLSQKHYEGKDNLSVHPAQL